MPTLADTYLADTCEGDGFVISSQDGQWRVTMPGPFGSVLLAKASDAGTLLGGLGLLMNGAQAILAQSDPESDPANIAWAFMAWLNGNQGATVHLGDFLSVANPDHGTRAALGGTNVAIVGEHFTFATDTFSGLAFIRAFAESVYSAANRAMHWLDTGATYRMEVPEALLSQSDKIELLGKRLNRVRFGIELGNPFAAALPPILSAVETWGWCSTPSETADEWRGFVRVKAESLGKLLRDIGNALAQCPEVGPVRLFDSSEAIELHVIRD